MKEYERLHFFLAPGIFDPEHVEPADLSETYFHLRPCFQRRHSIMLPPARDDWKTCAGSCGSVVRDFCSSECMFIHSSTGCSQGADSPPVSHDPHWSPVREGFLDQTDQKTSSSPGSASGPGPSSSLKPAPMFAAKWGQLPLSRWATSIDVDTQQVVYQLIDQHSWMWRALDIPEETHQMMENDPVDALGLEIGNTLHHRRHPPPLLTFKMTHAAAGGAHHPHNPHAAPQGKGVRQQQHQQHQHQHRQQEPITPTISPLHEFKVSQGQGPSGQNNMNGPDVEVRDDVSRAFLR